MAPTSFSKSQHPCSGPHDPAPTKPSPSLLTLSFIQTTAATLLSLLFPDTPTSLSRNLWSIQWCSLPGTPIFDFHLAIFHISFECFQYISPWSFWQIAPYPSPAHSICSNLLCPFSVAPLRSSMGVCSVVSDSLRPHGQWPARLLCPCHFLLQGIFPIQSSNPPLLYRQADSLPVRHLGNPPSKYAV